MGHVDVSVHGFQNRIPRWGAADQTISPEVCELALAQQGRQTGRTRLSAATCSKRFMLAEA